MAQSSQNTNTGTHNGHWTATATSSGTYEFATGGKYVDRNIDLVIPSAELSLSGTVKDISVSVTPTVGSKTSDGTKYKLSGEQTFNKNGQVTARASTKGFTDETTYSESDGVLASGKATVDTTLPVITLGASGTASVTVPVKVGTKTNNTYPFAVNGTANITGTATTSITSPGYGTNETGSGSVTGTAGVSGSMSVANPTVTGSATVKPNGLTAANGNAKISSAATTTQPSSGYYVAATPSTAATTTITQTKTLTTPGYLGTKDEITASGSVTGGSGSKYYIPITSSSLGNSAKSGVTYSENTSVIIPSEGALYIEEGYIGATKITLDQMLDGKDDTAGTSAPDIRSGKIAYDVNGKKLTGTMPNASLVSGSGDVVLDTTQYSMFEDQMIFEEVTQQDVNKGIDGYYVFKIKGSGTVTTNQAGYIGVETKSSNTAEKYYAVPAASISGSNKSVTASASASAYDSTSNLASGTYTSTATTGYTYHIDSSASASVATQTATKTITEGYIDEKTVTATVTGANNSKTAKTYLKDSTSSVASGSTLALGSTLTIGKGYYPSDRTFTVPSGSGALGNTDVTTTLSASAITSGYSKDSALKTSSTGLTAYMTLFADASGETGKVLSSITDKTMYMEVYTGTYSIT